jgi:hypothetical protein
MPELPEVEALKDFLTEHLVGHEIVRVLPVAISVLKTYDPPLTALEGHEVVAVHRHGKFLDVETDGGPHFVTHLARAGWLHWKDRLPDGPPRPGKGPLALRVALETGEGFDLTEAGTQKRLAVYVVADPQEVPGVARLGPDPLADDFDEAGLRRPPEGRTPPAQGRPARPDPDRRGGQRLQRRDPARGEDVPVQARVVPDPGRDPHALHGPAHDPHGGRRALPGRGRRPPEGGEEERPARPRPHRRALPGLRRHHPRGLLQRLLPPVLPDLPDGRQATGGPPDVQAS